MLWSLGDERYLDAMTSCMYHGVWCGFFGKAKETKEYGDFILRFQQMFEEIVRSKNILTE
jgi:hypothetical protein